jgi:hypothetical protein
MNRRIYSVLAALLTLLSIAPAALAVRTTLTPVNPPSLKATIAANSADYTEVGGDSANGYMFTATGRELILVHNTDAGSQNCTVVSTAIEGRTGDIAAYNLSAGEFAVFGPFPLLGWQQSSDGMIYINASHNNVKFTIVRLP